MSCFRGVRNKLALKVKYPSFILGDAKICRLPPFGQAPMKGGPNEQAKANSANQYH